MQHATIRNAFRRAGLALALSASVFALAGPRPASAGVRGLYVGDDYFSNLNSTLISNTKVSGYNTLILFTMNVNSNGDLTGPNNELLVTNGSYVGNSSWGSQLASLKSAPSCVNRIEICLGGWGGVSFPSIQSLVSSQGTGSGSILYRNFQALRSALPAVDAIDFDDESSYDLNSSVPFGRMLSSLGFRVSLAPYTNQGYWASLLSQLGPYNAGSGIVDAIYLQCYDGGAGNDPGSWISAFGGYNKVFPGLWTNTENLPATGLSTVTTKLRNWQSSYGITGGFMWANESDPAAHDGWAQAVAYGIDQPYFSIINKYSGNSMDLIGGDGDNGAPINTWSSDPNSLNQRWAIVPTADGAHFKLIAWDTGKAASVANDSTSTGAFIWDWDYNSDTAQMWDFVDAGSGWFKIRNVHSGLILDDYGYGTGNNTPIDQWTDNMTNGSGASPDNQLWRLQPSSNFGYFIRANTGGGEYICCQGQSAQNGAAIIQYQWENNPWFKWKFTNEGNGWYALFSVNSPSRVISVDNDSTANAVNTQLWDYNASDTSGSQQVRLVPKTDGNYRFYFESDGMSWDMPGGGVGNNVPLQQYPDNGNYWQEFSLERTP